MPNDMDLISRMTLLIFQLGVIVFAAWAGGRLFNKLKLPSVLGELIAGIIIGPYLLGSLPFLGFGKGLFPLFTDFPVSAELYGFTTFASIILLFLAGIETDLETLLHFSFGGFIVALFGVIFSFVLGDLAGVLASRYLFGTSYTFMHPIPLFLGVISTATSVGITARILSDNRKLDSPDGVTILSAAVIDDVLGIIALAIIIGLAKSHEVQWQQVATISLKAIAIWLGFTALGLIFSPKISKVLKKLKDQSSISIMSLALTFIVSGIFEKSGLAMIIGAYVMGLSLSKTDLSFTVRANLATLRSFFVPIFFCVMGMLVNLPQMFSWLSLTFGMLYVIFAVLGKMVGCGFPALFLNFNPRGALNIGLGMVPRGEVALIVAGIGIASGIIPHEVFSIAVLMTFVTTLIPPPILAKRFSSDKPVLRREIQIKKEYQKIIFAMPNPETAELILGKVLAAFNNEGFYVQHMDIPESLYHIRKDQTFITLKYTPQQFEFDCSLQESSFVHTVFYEVLADMEYLMKNLKNLTDKEKIGRKIFSPGNGAKKEAIKISQVIGPAAVEANLKGKNKTEIIEELTDLLVRSGQLRGDERSAVLGDLFQREANTSTGMQDGIALPHAKTSAVNRIIAAIGLKKSGVDFNSLDKKPSVIFIIILAPKEHPQPYLQFMAEVSKFLMDTSIRQKIIQAKNNSELYEIIRSF